MIKLSQKDIKPFVIYLLLVSFLRHLTLVLYSFYQTKTFQLKGYWTLITSETEYQNIISSSDIIAAFVYVALIKHCCGHNVTSALITSSIVYYLVGLYSAISNKSSKGGKSYSVLLDIGIQKAVLLTSIPAILASMIVCKCC